MPASIIVTVAGGRAMLTGSRRAMVGGRADAWKNNDQGADEAAHQP